MQIAKAAGAGLLLMYASSLAGVSPGSQTGPLQPVDLAHPDQAYPGLDATIQGWLDARRKDTRIDWPDGPLPGAQAMDLGIAQVAATSVPGFHTSPIAARSHPMLSMKSRNRPKKSTATIGLSPRAIPNPISTTDDTPSATQNGRSDLLLADFSSVFRADHSTISASARTAP
jgi:hypothetical protein